MRDEPRAHLAPVGFRPKRESLFSGILLGKRCSKLGPDTIGMKRRRKSGNPREREHQRILATSIRPPLPPSAVTARLRGALSLCGFLLGKNAQRMRRVIRHLNVQMDDSGEMDD
jgi:hypothetical protein